MELKALAEKMAKVYEENPKVEAIMIAGSVSRDWEDSYSDIELHLLWREAPDDSDRMGPIEKVGGKVIDFHEYEDEEWSETYWHDGVKFEISSFLSETITSVVGKVVLHHDTCLDMQCSVASFQDGKPLFGHSLLLDLKEKVSVYPDTLREKMILDNLDFGSRWGNREALLNREDWLMLYQVMVSVQSKLMGAMFGLNRMYVHHPAYKWQRKSLGRMSVLPDGFTERMEEVLVLHPVEGLRVLEGIIRDVFALLEREIPSMEMEIRTYKEKSVFVRSI
ncbi:hypothetical protein JOC95_001718 [Bacillus tianshenii]|uniref:DUF4037 domain-containing protein n=1 Tax=Sutcliffiella tianshenii TaxID=1463404 RepID=A0ABS2NYZ4_9BACI|nr:DUF4037 domain-containing protein [Bacillus tianshenii]MBM7619866.1 hypothetical protein [Bacillus tianshenii]